MNSLSLTLPLGYAFKTLTLNSTRTPTFTTFRASANPNPNPIVSPLRLAASTAVLLSATTAFLLSGRPLARADPIPVIETTVTDATTPSSELSPDTVASLKALVYQKLEQGEDFEVLPILYRLIASQPAELEWKLLAARVLNETGEPAESRKMYEEILAVDPLSFEALFENALLMDRAGERDAVIERLNQALDIAKSEGKDKPARDVRLIMAQIKYLQKNVDGALEDYEELSKEDASDYRPYFCQGVIFSLLERSKEAKEKFAMYKELAPNKFDVDAYLQSAVSRVNLFGTGQNSEI